MAVIDWYRCTLDIEAEAGEGPGCSKHVKTIGHQQNLLNSERAKQRRASLGVLPGAAREGLEEHAGFGHADLASDVGHRLGDRTRPWARSTGKKDQRCSTVPPQPRRNHGSSREK